MQPTNINAQAQSYIETARRNILALEELTGDAPHLSPEEHITFHLAIERGLSSLRSALRSIVKSDSKALADRWGPPKAQVPVEQMPLPEGMGDEDGASGSVIGPPPEESVEGEGEEPGLPGDSPTIRRARRARREQVGA